MGQLREVIEQLRKEYLRIKGTKTVGVQFSRLLIRGILKKYDLSRALRFVPWATGVEVRKPTASKSEFILRKQNPGLFDVVFINSHSKEKQILTRDSGIPYDVAQLFYNYITYFGDEKYNEHGRYEIMLHEKFHLPEESFIGL